MKKRINCHRKERFDSQRAYGAGGQTTSDSVRQVTTRYGIHPMKKSIRTVIEPTHEEIARLAYSLFEEGGRKDGYDVEHWLQAQAHLCTDSQHTSPFAKRPTERPEYSRP